MNSGDEAQSGGDGGGPASQIQITGVGGTDIQAFAPSAPDVREGALSTAYIQVGGAQSAHVSNFV